MRCVSDTPPRCGRLSRIDPRRCCLLHTPPHDAPAMIATSVPGDASLPSLPKSSARRASSPCRCAVRDPGPAGSCLTGALNAVFSHCSTASINAPDTIGVILGNCISQFARAVATVEVLFLVPLLRNMYLFQPHPCLASHQFVTHATAKIFVVAIQNRCERFFCYSGNETKPRGGKTHCVGGGT